MRAPRIKHVAWIVCCASVACESPSVSPVQVWSLNAAEQMPVGPSITYGVTPRGATAPHVALPLVHGLTYRVSVAYIVGGDGIAASGDRLFTF